MKKLLALVAVAFITTVCAFSLDLAGIKGTWTDEQWNGNWTFAADGTITLTSSTDGAVIFTFTDKNVKDFELITTDDGPGIAFYCKETERHYSFVKPLTLTKNLQLRIDPDWTEEDYGQEIIFKE